MQQLDPYPDIKQEVERELEEAAKLQTDLFAGKNAAAEQLKYQFNNVTEQLSALETAVKLMVDSPERFQLDRTTAYTRQVEVETLRWQLQDLQATCAQVQTAPGANGHSQKEVTFSDVEMHKCEQLSHGRFQRPRTRSGMLQLPYCLFSPLACFRDKPQLPHNSASGLSAAG